MRPSESKWFPDAPPNDLTIQKLLAQVMSIHTSTAPDCFACFLAADKAAAQKNIVTRVSKMLPCIRIVEKVAQD